MRHIMAAVACFFLVGCATSHQKFYKPINDAKNLLDVQFLNAGEIPKIVSSNDLERDGKIAISKGYVLIGESSFNGKIESEQAVVDQAKSVGAVFVLVSSKFTESRTITTPLFLPNNTTTYSSGSVRGLNYSGSSTTYGTTVVPITNQQQRYDQAAVFFVKSTKKLKIGVNFDDLTPELRSKYERNSGIVIKIVHEESPAFTANLLPDDIIIEINGKAVINSKQAPDLLQSALTDGKCIFKIIRNGTEKSIELKLGQN